MGHADPFADVQHRRFVALTFADDDRPVDRNGVHHLSHRLDSHLIGMMAVALSHRVRTGNCRLLDDAKEFQ
jgi:hypothetical protein